jgi:hypothetical protein
MREIARRGKGCAHGGPRAPAAAQAQPPAPPEPAAALARSLAESLRETLEIATPAGPVLVPAPGPYRSVFAWDSGWHYFWLKRLDPVRASAELASLLACAEPDSRIPHEKPLPGQAGYSLVRRLQLRLLRRSFAPSGASWFIDPPIYLVAAADALAGAPGGAATAAERPGARNAALADIEVRSRAALGWIGENRLAAFLPPPWNRVPALLHPLEPGTDFSPAFDAVWGKPPLLQLRSLAILPRLAREGWSLAGARSFPLPLLFDPCYLAFWLGARRALLPGPETEDLVEAYWRAAFDPSTGRFRQFAALPGSAPRPLGAATFSSLLPLLLHARGPHADEARCAIERNALPGGPFWQGELPGFNPGRRGRAGSSSLWRGACSWANMNYCHWSLLRLAGFGAEADLLLDRMTRRLASGPAWEFLDPDYRPTGPRRPGPDGNGATAGKRSGGPAAGRAANERAGGGGAEPFSWNGLLLAMAEGEVLDLGLDRP